MCVYVCVCVCGTEKGSTLGLLYLVGFIAISSSAQVKVDISPVSLPEESSQPH